MSRRIPIKALLLLMALGLLTYLITQSDEVSHAQTGGFDRTQYANDRPAGEFHSPDELPETGEFNVMIELFDPPSSKVYADTLGNRSDRAANPQQRAAAQSAARAQMVRIRGAQQRVLARLGNFGRRAKVLYNVQTAYNGIAARIDASILPQLRAHADVKGVYALPVHYIENSSSLPFIKAASAWRQRVATRVTGSGLPSLIPALTICTRISVDQALPPPTPPTTAPSSNPARSRLRRLSAEWTLPETLTRARMSQCRIRTRSTAMDTVHTLPAPPPDSVSTLTARLFLVHGTAQYLFVRSALDQA